MPFMPFWLFLTLFGLFMAIMDRIGSCWLSMDNGRGSYQLRSDFPIPRFHLFLTPFRWLRIDLLVSVKIPRRILSSISSGWMREYNRRKRAIN